MQIIEEVKERFDPKTATGKFVLRVLQEVIKETVEICDAHTESGYFDKEGALSNSLKILE